MKLKTMLCLIGALALAGGLSSANAAILGADSGDTASVLYSNSQMVQGAAANVATLTTPGAGELFLTLTDLDFPTSFASLQFALTDASAVLGSGLVDAGTVLTLDLTQPTTLYADVFALTKGQAGVGLYNLTATFLDSSPVPLPATGLLLAGGLLLLLLGLYSDRLAQMLVRARERLDVQAPVTASMA